MTRKDYIELAKAITLGAEDAHSWDTYDGTDSDGVEFARHRITERIALVLAADNPRFDRAKFFAACGVTS